MSTIAVQKTRQNDLPRHNALDIVRDNPAVVRVRCWSQLVLMVMVLSVSACTGENDSAWNAALSSGDVTEIKRMIANGFDPNRFIETRSKDSGSFVKLPPILIVSRSGSVDAVEVLIDAGADPNTRNENGWTAMFVATNSGHEELVRTLIARGASVDVIDDSGLSPLHIAASLGNNSLAEILLEAGADPNRIVPGGGCALHAAAGAGNLELVVNLLQHGAAVEKEGVGGLTPLMKALEYSNIEVAELLIKHGANIASFNRSGLMSPLLAAAGTRKGSGGVQFALSLGVDPNAQSADGMTALHWAARYGTSESVKLLMDAGADPTIVADDGTTALELAKLRQDELGREMIQIIQR